MHNHERPPTEPSSKSVEYAKEQMDELMRETFADADSTWKFNRDAIVDIVGYPYKGYHDNEFNIRLLVVMDPAIDNLGSDKPFVAVRIDKGFTITDEDHHKAGFMNSSRITNDEKLTEDDLQVFLESGERALYRINI